MRKTFLCIIIIILFFLAPILTANRRVSAENGEFPAAVDQQAVLVLGQPDFTSSEEATTQAGMRYPHAVTVDPTTGKVFVADQANNRVLRFASLVELTNGAAAEAVLGQPDFVHSGSGISAPNTMFSPLGLSVDTEGRLWVVDSGYNRVLRFDNASSKANGANADGVLGQPNMTYWSAALSQSRMEQPNDVFVDASGRLWVSDFGHNRVLRFDNAAAKPDGANADGVLGQALFTTRASAASQNGMNGPAGLFVDLSGRLWVTEYYNNRVLRFDNAALKSNGANADGVLGQEVFTSRSFACAQNGMNKPRGISGDLSGQLYVSDDNHRVLIFESAAGLSNGANASRVLGQAGFTTCTANPGGISAGTLSQPTRVFFDTAAGVLWVADWSNQRVLKYANTIQPAALVLGQPGFTSSAIATTAAGMVNPHAVAVDPTTGKVFVADQGNNRVLRFASLQALTNGAAAEAVLGQTGFFTGSSGPVESNTMYSPLGLSIDTGGRLWVVDSGNNRVLRFNNASSKANGASADGVLGQPSMTTKTAALTQSGIEQPNDVFADESGRLWVSDYKHNRVLRFDNAAAKSNGANADGVLGQANFTTGSIAGSQNGMYGPAGLFVDVSGRLWVTEYNNNRLLRFDNAALKANGANADGVLGQEVFTSYNSACTQDGMNGPRGVSGDLSGQLYVSDDNHRVLIFEGAAGLENGANASRVLGQANFTTCTSNPGGISAGTLNQPTRVFFDKASGVLWVADWNNQRVLMYTASTIQPAALVLGQPDFMSSASAVTAAGMEFPHAVAVDATTGKIFVADQGNNRVLRFASVGMLVNGAAAEAVLGQPDFVSGISGAVAANTMYSPLGVSVDIGGSLWVVDSGNNRVLRFDNASSKGNGANADGVLGQPNMTTKTAALTQGGLEQPNDVFADKSGRLWVSDFGHNRVLRFDNAAAKSNGDNADGVLGQANFTTAASAASQNGMNGPAGLFVDASGRLWVTEYNNNRVLRFDNAALKSNGANADGVLGQEIFTDSGPACTRNGMNAPRGVSGDLSGQLYVSDDNHRVLIFEAAAGLSNGANASRVFGQAGFTTCTANPGGISAGTLSQPTRVFFDTTASVLWVADWNNQRVLMYGTPKLRIFLPVVRK